MADNEEKKIFSTNLKFFLNQSGKMQIDVAKDLGVAIQTFNGWCNGVSIPSMGKVQKLADYFGVGKSDLLDKKPYDYFITTKEEKILIEIYRSMPEHEQEMLKRMMNYAERLKELNNDTDRKD